VYLYRRGECVRSFRRITKHQSPCSGVAKRCVQSIGRNATLILGSVEERCFLGGWRAWTPDLCYVIKDITLIPFSPVFQWSKPENNGSSWKKRGCQSFVINEIRRRNRVLCLVPGYHKYTVIDRYWMYVHVLACFDRYDMTCHLGVASDLVSLTKRTANGLHKVGTCRRQ
jgi:hypothetical protein